MRWASDAAGGRQDTRGVEQLVLTAVPLVLAAIAFAPITRNYFFADDFVDFYVIRNTSAFDYITAPQGGHLYLTRNTVWYLLYLAFGTEPAPYFWAEFLTHLLNVFLLLRAIDGLTGSRRLGCLGASLWGISPTNEGSLGWYSLHGHVLVATATLLLLGQLARVADGPPPTWRTAVAWVALLVVAATSFGVGLGIAMAFPIAVFLVLPPARGRTGLTAVTAVLAASLPFLYVGLYRLHPWPYAGGTTIGAVLAPIVNYWSQSLLLLLHLMVAGVASLIGGAAFEWNAYPGPFAYAIAGLFFAGLLGALVVGDAAVRRRLLACLALVLAGYAFIAMGRGPKLAEGNLIPLRALRYHYAVPALLAIVGCLTLSALGRAVRLNLTAAAQNVLLTAAILLIAWIHVGFAKPINNHGGARGLVSAALTAIRERIDAAPPGGVVYIPNGEFRGVGPVLRQVPEAFPGWAGVFVVFFPENVVDGKRVVFVDGRRGVLRAARRGRRTVDLLVHPDAVPPDGASGPAAHSG